MSSWHVIQVATPLMMGSVKNYIIIIFTLMTTIPGSPQTCLHYCKQSPTQAPIPPPGCDCSFHLIRKRRFITIKHQIVTPSDIRDGENYYEPAKFKSSQAQSINEQTFHMLNISSNLNFTQDTTNNTTFYQNSVPYNTSKSFGVQDSNQQYDSEYSHKYETRNNDKLNIVEETNDSTLHLYLDIDLDTSEHSNTSQLEKLIYMFENFQGAENNLSECINLHVYIFSRHINKTSTNWNPKVKHDTFSNPHELIEIQNECSQPSSIIKQSLYQIKQSLPKKITHSEIIQDKQETVYSVESKDDTVTQNKLYLSRNNKNSTISSDSQTSTTYSISNDYNVTPETSATEESNDVQSDKRYTERDDLNLLNNDYFIKQKAFTSAYNDDDDETHVAESIAVTNELGNIIITTKPNRPVYSEADLQIPRIITKELSNDKVFSAVDGNEEIPNSDFITYSISPTTTDKYPITNDERTLNASISNADIFNTNIDKSKLVQIHGELYILFGKKQIPARFIQQPNGELYVAIDGFSLCHQMLKENTTNFMNSFCNCIQLQN